MGLFNDLLDHRNGERIIQLNKICMEQKKLSVGTQLQAVCGFLGYWDFNWILVHGWECLSGKKKYSIWNLPFKVFSSAHKALYYKLSLLRTAFTIIWKLPIHHWYIIKFLTCSNTLSKSSITKKMSNGTHYKEIKQVTNKM